MTSERVGSRGVEATTEGISASSEGREVSVHNDAGRTTENRAGAGRNSRPDKRQAKKKKEMRKRDSRTQNTRKERAHTHGFVYQQKTNKQQRRKSYHRQSVKLSSRGTRKKSARNR